MRGLKYHLNKPVEFTHVWHFYAYTVILGLLLSMTPSGWLWRLL